MSLDDFYIKIVEQKKKGNMDVYKQTLIEVFGKEISWSEFNQSERNKQIEVMCKLEELIRLKESPIDIKKMAHTIQNSRSGAGGCAMTTFECVFCGEIEMWSNTAVPRICKACSNKMAENIAKHLYNHILKDGYNYVLEK